MNEKESKITQLEALIENQDNLTFSLHDVEILAENEKVLHKAEKKFPDKLYTSLLSSITHESFTEDEAKVLWGEIIEHLSSLKKILGRNVGIAVASLDYLTNIKGSLKELKIIEEKKSDFITETMMVDELTGLLIRDIFELIMKKKIHEAIRHDSPLSLLMIDIDDFKKVNDNFGHLEGDNVLHKVGETINAEVREMDFAARYGGEELTVLMPQSSIENVYEAGERIRKAIEEMKFNGFSVTISVGVATLSENTHTMKKLIKAADDALYQAKETGKNKVVIYQS
ncbi:MAG: GGDEF domain-containing protein [Nitrospinae bacterium]|nr:GGDEF domain-containing protein [Nitrospinota bacterium]